LPSHTSQATRSSFPADHGGERARGDHALFARRAAGDPKARRELVERFMPLARSVARRYERSGEPFEDLMQVASLGLVKAVDGYRPARGCAFSSYAVPTISGEIKRYFRDRTWTVRPPRDLQDLTVRVDRAPTELQQRLDRAPTLREIADGYERSEAVADLDRLLCHLPARDRLVLRLRFERDLTQAEIGACIGVSQMQVSRILRRTISELRVAAGGPPAS
jgi:RNA polymerase sigma-B factor